MQNAPFSPETRANPLLLLRRERSHKQWRNRSRPFRQGIWQSLHPSKIGRPNNDTRSLETSAALVLRYFDTRHYSLVVLWNLFVRRSSPWTNRRVYSRHIIDGDGCAKPFSEFRC
jgi:hypothetical protein